MKPTAYDVTTTSGTQSRKNTTKMEMLKRKRSACTMFCRVIRFVHSCCYVVPMPLFTKR